MSKFCTSLAALHPELPANRWTRALQRPWILEGSEIDGALPTNAAGRAGSAGRAGTARPASIAAFAVA